MIRAVHMDEQKPRVSRLRTLKLKTLKQPALLARKSVAHGVIAHGVLAYGSARELILGFLLTQYWIGERSIPERSQIPERKRGCRCLRLVLITAGLFSVIAPTLQAQPIRTYPTSVVWQGDGFDCGPAALATLLRLRLQRSPTLRELTDALPEISRQEWRRIQTHGYSLGQLVAMTAAVGVRATLHRLTARGLAEISLPVLVYLDLPSGPHYSVLTGMVGGQVALADPSQGAVVWPKAQFLSAWSTTGTGYALSITADPVG